GESPLPTLPADPASFAAGEILIQFDPSATAADRSRAFAAIGGRMISVLGGEGDDGDGGHVARMSLGHGVSMETALNVLSHLPGVTFAEPNYRVYTTATANDANVTGGQTWGLYGDVGAPANTYGSQATEAWAAGYTGSTHVAVGVVDTG